MSDQGYSDHAVRHDDGLQRVIWTAALANGAGLITLCNIVGGMADPDYALRTCSIPLNLFAGGLLAGSMAIGRLLVLPSLRTMEAIRRFRSDMANERQMLIKPAVSEWPMPLDLAHLIFGPDAENHVRKLYGEVVANAIKNTESSRAEFEEGISQQNKASEAIKAATNASSVWYGISIGLCIMGFLVAVNGMYFGRRLQPPPSPAAVHQSVALPIAGSTPARGPSPKTKKPGFTLSRGSAGE